MRKFLSILIASVFAVSSANAFAAAHAKAAGDKKMEKPAAGMIAIKEIAQNDKLRAYEATYKPGDGSPSAKRPMRAVRALKGGTLERTYEDGKKEKIEWKTGETRIISEERPYSVKNIGKGVVHLYVVQMK